MPRGHLFLSTTPIGRGMLPGLDSGSVEIDTMPYKCDLDDACCIPSGACCLDFSRTLIPVLACNVSCPGLSAFGGSLMESICIRSSVEKLRHSCFSECWSLAAVTFEADSRLACIEHSAFLCCPRVPTICITSSGETLGQICFLKCHFLSNGTFGSPSKLVCIGPSCFVNCPLLCHFQSFTSDSRLSSLDYLPFWRCSCLSSIRAPSSVERFGTECFFRCRLLRTAAFPSNSYRS
jgi:hypothetical protein